MKKELIVALVVAVIVGGMCVFTIKNPAAQGKALGAGQPAWTEGAQLEYANVLLSKGLKSQAAGALEDYLKKASVSRKELAGAAYKLGNTYMDLGEFEKALGSYYRSEILEPNAEFKQELGQRVVEALEKMGLTQQAKYELESRTSLNPAPKPQGVPVARIGKREIMQSEIDSAIENIPPWARGELNTDEGKLKFIRQYVAGEILYDKAQRLGFDHNQKLIDAIDNYKKNIIVQALMQKEVEQNLKIDPDDLQLYYKANKEKYVVPAKDKEPQKELSFEEAKNQVESDYRNKKQQDIVNSLINKSLEQQEVEILFPRQEAGKPSKDNGNQKK